MNSRLIVIMNDELNMLESLLKLLENQYNLLVDVEKDVVKISEIAEEIDNLIKEIAKCEMEKRQLLQGKSLAEVVENCNNKQVSDTYARTLSLLEMITAQKDTNNLFIKQQLFFTKSMIRAITPRRDAEMYDNLGKIKK